MRRLGLAPWVILFFLGCEKAPPEVAPLPTVTLSNVRFEDETPPDLRPVELPKPPLEAGLKRALNQGGLATVDGAPLLAKVKARVLYGIATDTGIAPKLGPGRAKVAWTLELVIRDAHGLQVTNALLELSQEEPYDGKAPLKPALERLNEQVMAKVREETAARVGLLSLEGEALLAKLKDPKPAVRLAAADRVATLRMRSASLAVAARAAEEPEREVKLRLIGVLAELGDERATPALIELADTKDLELLRAVLDALSVLGGERVDDLLEVLSNHDSPAIKEMVEDAKKRLAKPGAELGPVSPDAGSERTP